MASAGKSDGGGSPQGAEFERFLLRFPKGIVVLDDDLRVRLVNARARRVPGLHGLRRGSSLRGEAKAPLRAVAERLVRGREPLPPTLLELGGRTIEASGVPAQGGAPAVLVLDDVTEQERNDLAMREFVRNAAHQLRTPLTGIASAVHVLQTGAKEVPADRDRFLEHVEHHVDRLTHIVRGLLTLARARSGTPAPLDRVALRPLLEEAAAAVAPGEAVAIEVRCDPGLAALCKADLTREALAALVENAVQWTTDGTIRLAASEEEGVVRVDVADTGPGILPEHRERLLEPFYRAADGHGGFGLGLAIASQAVEAMQGTLEVAEPALGSCFTIRLRSARQ